MPAEIIPSRSSEIEILPSLSVSSAANRRIAARSYNNCGRVRVSLSLRLRLRSRLKGQRSGEARRVSVIASVTASVRMNVRLRMTPW